MNATVDITPFGLFVSLIFILIAGITSFRFKLELERKLLIGTVRTFAQLYLMGYALGIIFDLNNPILVALVFSTMIAMAAHTVSMQVKEKSIPYRWPMLLSMLVSYSFISYIVLAVVVSPSPWWTPQYFIPLAGMIIGNSMNALAIALDRLFADIRNRKDEIEMKLSLGANVEEATQTIIKDSLRAGMIPSINSMMGVGLVFIPGMMTGQVLAGEDPTRAIKYQIIVMLMIVGATSLSTFIVVQLAKKRCFGPGGNILLRKK